MQYNNGYADNVGSTRKKKRKKILRTLNIPSQQTVAEKVIEFMEKEADHRGQMDLRRLELDEKRLEKEEDARKDAAELRKLEVEGKKTLADGQHAMAAARTEMAKNWKKQRK